MKLYIRNFKNRLFELRMIHIALDSTVWHPLDVVFLFTGKLL